MTEILAFLEKIGTPGAVLIGVALATIGWLYAARLQRTLMRKEHSVNALLQASFTKEYQDAINAVRDYIRAGKFPDLEDQKHKALREHVIFLMNHYEVLAASIRNGEMSEQLLKDTEKGGMVRMFETAESSGYITSVRDERRRKTILEHFEWLYERWVEKPPPWWQRAVEGLLGRPLYHRYHRWIIVAMAVVLLLAVIEVMIHD